MKLGSWNILDFIISITSFIFTCYNTILLLTGAENIK